ncbi:Pex12 amino terminal region-domain-containing protein [Collybia nuda]|uniref:RING-type E3 ubiquitin transferase (cysteine targeting) n=1 Tax=Collybia nuda TaxID=64659 RepID=A0A9P5YAQ0_9AGAR|nr:Pex12 amino terminal region-domain-containing protein [Collybia nuda]
MPTSPSWEDAWNDAQTTLSSIRDALNANDSPDPRIIRVGQLDSELLDQELVHLLQEPLERAFSLLSASVKAKFAPELTLLIQVVLYKLSIWNTGASYGAKLQDLRYVVPSSSRKSFTPSGLPRQILLIHGTMTILLPYLHAKLRTHALSSAWPDAPSSDRRRKAWNIMTSLESIYTLLGLTSFLAFMWDGRYRTIVDRLLHMRLVPSRRLVKRDVSYEFMNRQMVWHAFTEFLLFLLPLVSARTIRRRINRMKNIASGFSLASFLPISAIPHIKTHRVTSPKRGKYWNFPQDQCAICSENASFNLNPSDPVNAFTSLITGSAQQSSSPEHMTPNSDMEPPPFPVYNPYITSCGDIYCYHCIAERMMRVADDGKDSPGWQCLRCGEGVKGAERYIVEMESELSGSDYEFSSDLDLDSTDISESMGSYTGSGLSDS